MATPQQYPVVKYAFPLQGKEDLRFHLIQDNGNRVSIRLIDDRFTIKPVECLAKSEITIVY